MSVTDAFISEMISSKNSSTLVIEHGLLISRVGIFPYEWSRTVGREFASRPGHTKDHHKNGTNCLPA